MAALVNNNEITSRSPFRHGRACPGHLGLACSKRGVDAWHKAGHDEVGEGVALFAFAACNDKNPARFPGRAQIASFNFANKLICGYASRLGHDALVCPGFERLSDKHAAKAVGGLLVCILVRGALMNYAATRAVLKRNSAMKAKDVMTPSVLSIAPDASVSAAAHLMLQNKISGLPVIDGSGKLVGIITEGDFLRRTEIGTQRRRPRWIEFFIGPGRLADEYSRSSGRTISDVMTHNVYTVDAEAPLEDVVRMMESHRIKRVPVIQGGKVVGIVTRANLLHALASIADEIAPSPAGDNAIREQIYAELKRQAWTPVARIDVTVRNGVVQLSGALTDERQRDALRILAENTPGVKKVQDHLVWIDPETGMYIEGQG